MVLIRSRLYGPNISHTWFQEPMRFEDPYGRIWPIPVEYNYMMVEGLVRGKFKSGRGKSLVERDQWQLFESTNTKHIFSPENWEPIPGMKITMVISDDNSANSPLTRLLASPLYSGATHPRLTLDTSCSVTFLLSLLVTNHDLLTIRLCRAKDDMYPMRIFRQRLHNKR
jgi:hypothetical protein